eukprot:12786450-Prorocentrum_lima.AAC.1
MTSSLVGSEMCIRDSPSVDINLACLRERRDDSRVALFSQGRRLGEYFICLLYTSDAADDM